MEGSNLGKRKLEDDSQSLGSEKMKKVVAEDEFIGRLDSQLIGSVKMKKVVEEDEFIAKIDNIIERDYYPDLWKLRHYYGLLSQGQTALRQDISPNVLIQTPNLLNPPTPATQWNPPSYFDEHCSKPSDVDGGDDGCTLDSYLSTHTSEDNDSFHSILQVDREKYMKRNFWAFNDPSLPALTDPSYMLYMLPDGRRLSISDRQKLDAIKDSPIVVDVDVSSSSSSSSGDHTSLIEYDARNSLMFPPAQLANPALVVGNDNSKNIVKRNTRFQSSSLVHAVDDDDGFLIPKLSRREIIAHQLATPSPVSNSKSSLSTPRMRMSPAAASLTKRLSSSSKK